MSYRPITDTWILARSKVKYHGAYPAGFLHRARALLGVSKKDPVLHVCAGKVRDYPYRGLGRFDMTVDLDPNCGPDFTLDVRDGLPFPPEAISRRYWAAVLIDRPYTEEDAAHYLPGAAKLPNLNSLLKAGFSVVDVDSRVGILDYMWPHPGNVGLEVAIVGVGTGRNSRARWFSVFERVK